MRPSKSAAQSLANLNSCTQKPITMGGMGQHDGNMCVTGGTREKVVTARAAQRHRMRSARRNTALSMVGRIAVVTDEWFESAARAWETSDASAGARARNGGKALLP